ncbi:MAG: FAD-dependent oxidoreductase [Azospirillaceae bacterium]|nr:FAD-dependent oxidoreductase [Azospirillaceae bacterium]
MRITIIGAGIIGATVAHELLDQGHDVVLIDPEEPGSGASRGNAGWIAHLDILPLASPKAWHNMPRWMLDPLGPLSIRPAYLPRLAPYLLRFLLASRAGARAAGTQAIIALNGLALPAWERRLAALGLSDHLRRRGLLSVWSRPADFAAAQPVIEAQKALGIAVELFDGAGVRRLEPAFGPVVVGGAWYPAGCHVADPRDLTVAIASAAVQRGATLIRAKVESLDATAEGVRLTLAGVPREAADLVVIAAGAWSRPLASDVGDAVPLDTERGYNITLARGTLGLERPVMFEGEGMVTSPLDSGDRIGGAVEFAGLDAPANMARVDAMLARLRRFLPGFTDGVVGERWMGCRPSIPDSLPVIGRSARHANVIHAFGHGHYGLTQAAATAELVGAMVAGQAAPIDPAPFAVTRF